MNTKIIQVKMETFIMNLVSQHKVTEEKLSRFLAIGEFWRLKIQFSCVHLSLLASNGLLTAGKPLSSYFNIWETWMNHLIDTDKVSHNLLLGSFRHFCTLSEKRLLKNYFKIDTLAYTVNFADDLTCKIKPTQISSYHAQKTEPSVLRQRRSNVTILHHHVEIGYETALKLQFILKKYVHFKIPELLKILTNTLLILCK